MSVLPPTERQEEVHRPALVMITTHQTSSGVQVFGDKEITERNLCSADANNRACKGSTIVEPTDSRSGGVETGFINSLAVAEIVCVGGGCHSYWWERKDKRVRGEGEELRTRC